MTSRIVRCHFHTYNGVEWEHVISHITWGKSGDDIMCRLLTSPEMANERRFAAAGSTPRGLLKPMWDLEG